MQKLTKEPTKVAVIGTGNRANKYLKYCEIHPEKLRLVAIAEVNTLRREACAKRFGLSKNQCFEDYRKMLEEGVDVDMVLITTPDHLHYAPVMESIRCGHHVLIEKPIAQTLDQCLEIMALAHEKKVKVGVCHVLRFHPYFCKLKQLVAEKKYGEVVSIQHSVSVGLDRATHSFVRGLFSNSQKSNPMLISKCCHDMDFLLWIADKRCQKVSSFGSLKWFREENAPEGSSERCVDCLIEKQCPYSAKNLYWERRDWISNFDIPDGGTIVDAIKKELNEGEYGRCVFHCQNDVVDHQTVILQMEDGVTLSLVMDMFTADDLRRTTIHLTHGEIYGDECRIIAQDYKGHREEFDFHEQMQMPFHAGADLKLIEKFIDSLHEPNSTLSISAASLLDSYVVSHAAERSRKEGQVISLEE